MSPACHLTGWLGGVLALLLAGCAAPRVATVPARLDPGVAAQQAGPQSEPLSLEQIIARTQAGEGSAALVGEIRRRGTAAAVSPDELRRLRAEGVDEAVVDELLAADVRRLRDQATAEKVRRQTAEVEAADRARAEAERRQAASYGYGYGAYPYYGSFGWSLGYGYRHYSPRPYRGGIGWGIGYRR